MQTKKSILVSGLATFLLVVGIISYDRQIGTVSAGTEHNLSGWAWSGNIGWISFNSLNGSPGLDYGVNVTNPDSNPLTGQLSGYAWNDNVGWINFGCGAPDPDPAKVGYKLCAETVNAAPAYPSSSGPASVTNNALQGFARACTVFASGCSGPLKPDYQLGGWDGWVSLSGIAADGHPYGVTYNPNNNGAKTFGTYGQNSASFAWGDTNIGWVSFQPRDPQKSEPDGSKPCLTDMSLCGVILGRPALGVSCTVNKPTGNTSPVTATWMASPRGGSGNYLYKWTLYKTSATCSPDSDTDFSSISKSKTTTCSSSANSSGIVNATVDVTDGTDTKTSAQCLNTDGTAGIHINQPVAGYSLSANPATVAAIFGSNLKATTSPVSIVSVVPFGPPNPAFTAPSVDLIKFIDPQVLSTIGLSSSDIAFQFSYTTGSNPATWPILTDAITSHGTAAYDQNHVQVNSVYQQVSLQISLKKKPLRNGSFQVQVQSTDGMSTTLTVNVDKGVSGVQEQ